MNTTITFNGECYTVTNVDALTDEFTSWPGIDELFIESMNDIVMETGVTYEDLNARTSALCEEGILFTPGSFWFDKAITEASCRIFITDLIETLRMESENASY